MSEPRWTPGPWESSGSVVYANRPEDGGTICQVSEVRGSRYVQHREPDLGSPDSKEIYANARLIAASPELFDALTSIAAVFCGNGTREDYENAYRESGIAAIKKALGRL